MWDVGLFCVWAWFATWQVRFTWSTPAGISCDVHAHWGSTLYHLPDLPFYSNSSRTIHGSGASGAHTARPQAGGNAPEPSAAPAVPGLPGLRLSSEGSRLLAGLPTVMTDMRRALEASGTQVPRPMPRPSLIPPLPPGYEVSAGQPSGGDEFSQESSCRGNSSSSSSSSHGPLSSGRIPASVNEAYQAAGGQEALAALQQLVGVDYAAHPSLAIQGMTGRGPARAYHQYPALPA